MGSEILSFPASPSYPRYQADISDVSNALKIKEKFDENEKVVDEIKSTINSLHSIPPNRSQNSPN